MAVGWQPPGADGERLLVLAEVGRGGRIDDGPLAAGAAARILERTGVAPHQVLLLAPGTLPRTSSGKLRRREALRRFLAGTLAAPAPIGLLGLIGLDGPLGARRRALEADWMSGRTRDLVVVGGGPAGLALAVAASLRGLDVAVVEARRFPVDQACGEGLLPDGVRALEALGARARLGPDGTSAITALRWIDVAGPAMEVALPAPGGLGVRRTALSAALLARALEAGAEVIEAEVTGHRRLDRPGGGDHRRRPAARPAAGRGRRARVADPAARGARRAAPARGRASGSGATWRSPPWSAAVEVHLAEGAEAYVTPAGAGRIGVAMLFEREAPGGWPALLARFPRLAARLAGAGADSGDRGAGPLVRGSTARVRDRLVLLGDAAGSVDPLSGDGVSSALSGAIELAALLPGALAAGASRGALAGWERAWGRRHRRSAAWTALLLAVASRPELRRRLLTLGGARRWPAERLLALALG